MTNLIKKDKELLIKNGGAFDAFRQVMEESFPYNEKRSREDYREQLNDPLFQVDLYHSGADLVGFIGWWHIENYRFVEHFAVSSVYRGKNFGSMIFTDFLNQDPSTVYLEVEPPNSVNSNRRIIFYERLGFSMLPNEYHQPSYHEEGEKLKMRIMTNGKQLLEHDFISLQKMIYRTVYKIWQSPSF